MNAELKYLSDIASALEALAGGKVAKSATTTTTATSKSGGSSSTSVAAEIDAPGVADILEQGLLTTILQEQQQVQVSAVKSMADGIRAELDKALFKEVTVSGSTVKKSIFLLIHEKLSNMQISTSLAALSDTNISGVQNGEFLQYNSNGNDPAWINVLPSDVLLSIMGSQQKGSNVRPIYWTGTAWQYINYVLGPACEKAVATSIGSLSTDGSLATAKAVYDFVSKITTYEGIVDGATGLVSGNAIYDYLSLYYGNTKSKGLATTANQFVSGGGDLATAGGVYAYITDKTISQSSDITSTATGFPTGKAVYDYVNAHASSVRDFTWNGGTTSGPQPVLGLGESSLTGSAIPAATQQASGIVTTAEQHFGGIKRFHGILYALSDFSVSGTSAFVDAATFNGIATFNSKVLPTYLKIPTSAPSTSDGNYYIFIDTTAVTFS